MFDFNHLSKPVWWITDRAEVLPRPLRLAKLNISTFSSTFTVQKRPRGGEGERTRDPLTLAACQRFPFVLIAVRKRSDYSK